MRHMIRPLKGLFVLSLTVTAAVALSACRETETGRPISLQKGTYQGKADTPLSPETLKVLRQRTAGQGLSTL